MPSVELTKEQLTKITKLVYIEAYTTSINNLKKVSKGEISKIDVEKDFKNSMAASFIEKLPWND